MIPNFIGSQEYLAENSFKTVSSLQNLSLGGIIDVGFFFLNWEISSSNPDLAILFVLLEK